MSEMARIRELMEQQGSIGCIPESNHYRVTGPTRTMVHVIANAWGYRVRTSVEFLGDSKYLLWYRAIIPQ